MGTLEGKTALVFGIANRHSIAYGIARALRAEGATVGLVHRRPGRADRVGAIAAELGAAFVGHCDVRDDAAVEAVVEAATAPGALGPRLDVLVHSIAFAEREDLVGRFVDTRREGWRTALEVSAYSLVAMARAAAPRMSRGGAIIALSAIGGERVLPHYNVMGVAKAALEASVRYLAADLGPFGIRVNAISAGPIRTVAATSVPGFRSAYRQAAALAPLRTGVDRDDVGRAVAWLCSDGAARITGQVIQVDAGWSILGLSGSPEDAPRSR